MHTVQTRVLALINRILHHGPPQNELRFRHIGDQIYELKTRGGTRILSFYGGEYLPNSLILAQGFYKPKNKILMRQKKRTMKWREHCAPIIAKVIEEKYGEALQETAVASLQKLVADSLPKVQKEYKMSELLELIYKENLGEAQAQEA